MNHPATRRWIVSVLFALELAAIVVGATLWFITAELKPIGVLLMKLGAGGAFFTKLAITYRRRQLERS